MYSWARCLGVGCVAGWLLAAGGCGGGAAVKKDDKPSAPVVGESEDLEVVFTNIFNVPPDTRLPARLREPGSVQDAQDIVRSDNISLFTKADSVLTAHLKANPGDVKNQTWHAQLFLAWADSAALTRKTLGNSVERLKARKATLDEVLADASASAEDKDQARADQASLEKLLGATDALLATLDTVAKEKLAVGEQKTQELLKQHWDSYEGYRLGADLARLKDDWDGFDKNLAQLEKLNPDSNGLRFLKGMVAFQKDKDYATAEKHLADAMAHDANFAKAQYYLALALINQRRFDDASKAIAQTLAISPGHPFANAVRSFVMRARKY